MLEQAQQDETRTPSTWECFATAIEFLTRLSVRGANNWSTDEYVNALRRSVVFFPIVGGLIGLTTGLQLVGLLLTGLPPLVAALTALGMEALLTGAFHEDAFADTCDALGGGWTREQVLDIMKDSRLGTYGTIALVIGVGARAAAMAAMAESNVWWALAAIVAAATAGRIAIVVMMATTAPISDRNSQARTVSGTQTMGRSATAALISLPFWILWLVMSPQCAVISLLMSAVMLVWFRSLIMKRIGGTTGDLLGASCFLTQLVVIIGAAAR